MEYLKLQPVLRAPENGLVAPTPIRQGIQFRHVSFSYPGSDVEVRDITSTSSRASGSRWSG